MAKSKTLPTSPKGDEVKQDDFAEERIEALNADKDQNGIPDRQDGEAMTALSNAEKENEDASKEAVKENEKQTEKSKKNSDKERHVFSNETLTKEDHGVKQVVDGDKVTITLPHAEEVEGKEFTIEKGIGSKVGISAPVGETLEGEDLSPEVNKYFVNEGDQGDSVTVKSDGKGWKVVSKKGSWNRE